jgi:hypothetical protein
VARRGPAGNPSAARFLPVHDQRPAHGAQVVPTSLYKVRMAPCGINRIPALRGPAGSRSPCNTVAACPRWFVPCVLVVSTSRAVLLDPLLVNCAEFTRGQKEMASGHNICRPAWRSGPCSSARSVVRGAHSRLCILFRRTLQPLRDLPNSNRPLRRFCKKNCGADISRRHTVAASVALLGLP